MTQAVDKVRQQSGLFTDENPEDTPESVEKANHFEPLVNLGFKTATEAIEFAIKHQLIAVNLSNLGGLQDEHLITFVENNPRIKSIYRNAVKGR